MPNLQSILKLDNLENFCCFFPAEAEIQAFKSQKIIWGMNNGAEQNSIYQNKFHKITHFSDFNMCSFQFQLEKAAEIFKGRDLDPATIYGQS